MAKVLKLATFPVARKRESKRAKQGELMVLPVATPAAPRRLNVSLHYPFIVMTQRIAETRESRNAKLITKVMEQVKHDRVLLQTEFSRKSARNLTQVSEHTVFFGRPSFLADRFIMDTFCATHVLCNLVVLCSCVICAVVSFVQLCHLCSFVICAFGHFCSCVICAVLSFVQLVICVVMSFLQFCHLCSCVVCAVWSFVHLSQLSAQLFLQGLNFYLFQLRISFNAWAAKTGFTI